MKIILLSLLLICLEGCMPRKVSEQKEKSISILLDLTTYEKNPHGVKKEFEKVADEILVTLQSEDTYEAFLGGKVSLNVIDDRGENYPLWEIRLSRKLGMHKTQYIKSLKELGGRFNETFKDLDKNSKPYLKSMIIESILSSLKQIKEGDSLYVISDLHVVDKKANFEKMKFPSPVDMSSYTQGKTVILRRIPLLGSDHEQINVVESWWKSSLEGNELFFQKALRAWEESNKSQVQKLTQEDGLNAKEIPALKLPIKRPKVTKFVDLSRLGRSVIAKNAKRLKICYDSELRKSELPFSGTLGIEVVLFENGKVKTVKVKKETGVINDEVTSCVKNVIARLDFPGPPSGFQGIVRQSLNFNVHL